MLHVQVGFTFLCLGRFEINLHTHQGVGTHSKGFSKPHAYVSRQAEPPFSRLLTF
ncbi:hypothetical protein GCM10007868_28700 [Gluconobacter frateurii]|uniref:Uncharacterized protein n=1 Tax=Gluconobacter frateurii NRIC 0228 TaxID=1307946 RepID=A0ABQ0Q9F8_9PROT|nr:hypothetical protein AA0228_0840 [Gluconobacter frateurii NRIC 0228]GLP91795.1 hypothetical protein GCM10007868_28700 [Gluconobacter frateurii]